MQKKCSAKQNFAYQNKVAIQTTMSHVQFVTGILLVNALQRVVECKENSA